MVQCHSPVSKEQSMVLVAQRAFNQSKNWLTSSNLLFHFEPKLPLPLACDALPHGVGVALAHMISDGRERLIDYVHFLIADKC